LNCGWGQRGGAITIYNNGNHGDPMGLEIKDWFKIYLLIFHVMCLYIFSYFNHNRGGNCDGNDVAELTDRRHYLKDNYWPGSISGSNIIKVWAREGGADGTCDDHQNDQDYSYLLPNIPAVHNPKNPLYVGNDGIDRHSCYNETNMKCASITFAALTPLTDTEFTIYVAEGSYVEARIGVSSKTLTVESSSKDKTIVMLGHSYTHVFECTNDGSLILNDFTFLFFPIKDQNINMIHFNSNSGRFEMNNCIVKGHLIPLLSNTFLKGSSFLISNCEYINITTSDNTNGGAIYTSGGTFSILNTIINNTRAHEGGGIYIDRVSIIYFIFD
jgi:hypothetical protein